MQAFKHGNRANHGGPHGMNQAPVLVWQHDCILALSIYLVHIHISKKGMVLEMLSYCKLLALRIHGHTLQAIIIPWHHVTRFPCLQVCQAFYDLMQSILLAMPCAVAITE